MVWNKAMAASGAPKLMVPAMAMVSLCPTEPCSRIFQTPSECPIRAIDHHLLERSQPDTLLSEDIAPM